MEFPDYLTKDADCGVYKSVNDKKKYRFLTLNNGLKVFLIQDERKKQQTYDQSEDVLQLGAKRPRLSIEQTATIECEKSKTIEECGADKMAAMALCVNVGGFAETKELGGLAHFVEHVVLMGNKEYPVVNEFDNYVNTRCGFNNAFTENEYTTYEAQIPNSYIDGSLKRFAACFKSPLFKQEHIESELNPVNNEFVDSFVDDDVRLDHFVSVCLAKNDHKYSNFIWGNAKSLKEIPESKGIDVRLEMIKFFEKHYKASRMSLVVQSQENLDLIESLVREYFEGIPTEPNNDPTPEKSNEDLLIQELLSIDDVFAEKEFPFERDTLTHLYKVEPVEEGHILQLIYVYPPLVKFFKYKPLHTLSNILGYEGKNSLIQFLIQKKLILEFHTSYDDTCAFHSSKDYHSLFCLIIKLTDQGIQNVDLVVRYINYYINMMVREGPQELFFNEERLISLIGIRFEDETASISNVVDLSKHLFLYPFEYIIVANKLLYKFNREAVQYCLNYLKNQPRLSIILSSKAFNSSKYPTQMDFYTDIKYKVEPLPEQWNESLPENEELISSLKLPPPNEFISTDFEIKTQHRFYSIPVVLDEDSHYTFFFKNDSVFKKPKACIFLNYESNIFAKNLDAFVSFLLYIKYFNIVITEHTYPAEMCGLHYEVFFKNHSLELKASGFNHKLLKLVKLILGQFIECKIDPKLFETIKLDFIREYYNTLINNEDLVKNVSGYLQLKNSQLLTERREIAKRLDIKTVSNHVLNYLKTSYCQVLVQGNYAENEVHEIFDYIKSTNLSVRENVKLREVKKSYIHQIPIGKHYCYLKSFNKKDENILLHNSYQLGKLNEEEIVMLNLMMQEMHDPLFNILRNEQTLAYNLYGHYTRSKNDICSYQIVVKSLADKFTPQHVDRQIELFLVHFLNENINKMTEQHFVDLIEAAIKNKQIPFNKLLDEANYNWREIRDYTYKFNRKDEEIQLLKKIKLAKFVEFVNKVLKRTDSNRKLSICLIGTGDKSEELFECSNEIGVIASDGDEVNNDEAVYSLIYMKPKELNII